MKSRGLALSALVCAAVLLAWPAVTFAQRTSSGGEVTGTAVPRGGDSGGAVSRGGDAGSSGSSMGSSGGSMGTGSMGTASAPSGPVHLPGEIGVRRAPGSSRDVAAPVPAGIPEQSRPRGARPAQGEAVQRGAGFPGQQPDASGGSTGYGYGYGYGYPNGYGYGYPYGYGYGYGYNYWGYNPWFYSPYGSYYPFAYGLYGLGMTHFLYDPFYAHLYTMDYGRSGEADAAVFTGSIKLKVKPKDAQVYVDGAYVGRVGDFDGAFERLELEAGPHRIEVKAEGYETLTFEVRSLPGRTITYEGELKK